MLISCRTILSEDFANLLHSQVILFVWYLFIGVLVLGVWGGTGRLTLFYMTVITIIIIETVLQSKKLHQCTGDYDFVYPIICAWSIYNMIASYMIRFCTVTYN